MQITTVIYQLLSGNEIQVANICLNCRVSLDVIIIHELHGDTSLKQNFGPQ